jgi:hypothetical protein
LGVSTKPFSWHVYLFAIILLYTNGSITYVKTTIGSTINTEQKGLLLDGALAACSKLMTDGEKPLGAAVQQKPVLNLWPHSVIVTNKRVILHQPEPLKTNFVDFLWKDILKVHLTDRIFGSQLTFQFKGGHLSTSYLPKNQAKKVYAIAQAREEEWVEKRRMRSIEEQRAKSGANHIVVGNKEGSTTSIKDRLVELEELLKDGLLTQDEYQNKKMEILELV